MKPRKLFIVLWLLIFSLSCSSVKSGKYVNVDYVYDPEVDFNALKSYNWFPIGEKNAKYWLIVKQIKAEMNVQLKVRGLTMSTTNPDFLIAIHGGLLYWLDYTEWAYLHDNYEEYALKRKADFSKYSEDTIIVDFIDDDTGTLIYRATAIVPISIEPAPEKRQKKISSAVTKILDAYTQMVLNQS
jgi:hypothetical protein